MRIRVRVSNYKQFGRLATRFRQAADGQLQQDLAEGVRRPAPVVVAKIRTTVRGASFPAAPPAGGADPAGFRVRLAAATRSRPIPRGVQFYVDGAAVGPRGHRLAMLSDTELAPRWRHPVHGNFDRWVTQVGQPWFFAPIRPEDIRFAAGVLEAMGKTADRIMR